MDNKIKKFIDKVNKSFSEHESYDDDSVYMVKVTVEDFDYFRLAEVLIREGYSVIIMPDLDGVMVATVFLSV